MKFLLDESAEYRLVAFLQAQGHDVTAVAHEYPNALTDREVLSIALNERRVLITNDADFGELVFREGLPHAGIILFRLPPGDTDAKIRRFGRLLATHSGRLTNFVVVDRRGVRV